jgi:hypothetical protein
MSLPELSDRQIDVYYGGCPKFGGCRSKDQVRGLEGGKFYVLNMDHPRGQGTHWVLFWLCDPVWAIYFDSFGAPIPQEELSWVARHRKGNLMANERDVQAIYSAQCGYFCLYVADLLLKGVPFHRILDGFSPRVRENERMIRDWAVTRGFG